MKDLKGKRFGRLTVIEKAGNSPSRCIRWLCKCDCGNECMPESRNLLNGSIQSCRCYQKEKASEGKKYDFITIHKSKNPRIYRTWINIKSRCLNPNATKYQNYGGRGIIICDDWDKSFKSFYEWSISNGYTDKLTIDRIDVDGNYCPENCRWITNKEQQMNKRTNKSYKNEKRCSIKEIIN